MVCGAGGQRGRGRCEGRGDECDGSEGDMKRQRCGCLFCQWESTIGACNDIAPDDCVCLSSNRSLTSCRVTLCFTRDVQRLLHKYIGGCQLPRIEISTQ